MRVDRLERLYALAEEDRQDEVPEGPSDWSGRSLAVADPAGLVRHVLSAIRSFVPAMIAPIGA
jgi:hypothetical protein